MRVKSARLRGRIAAMTRQIREDVALFARRAAWRALQGEKEIRT